MNPTPAPARRLGRLLGGGLATRIGLGSAVSVLIAASIILVLDFRDARTDLVAHLGDNLETTVRVGAGRLDPALHAAAAGSLDPGNPAFLQLRDTLRAVQAEARVPSPIYTLRRDGETTRFVVMTNETPFIGDPYELRPGVKRTFEGGGAGRAGPYTDDHGTWISAWSPVQGTDGTVIAVLQADYEITTLVHALRDRALRTVAFALVAVLAAFGAAALLARGIARPIAAIAVAARRIETGDFSVQVPESGADEMGELARAVNRMARGLAERERLRDMFGKYMATQVMDKLLDGGDVELAGEEREVTVLLSDIRGFAALTEQLGAAEVVTLLNEYFTLLVNVVMAEDGVVDKFMGDAMLCYYGAPVAQADHRERAVRTGIRILEALDRWNQGRISSGLAPISTGIGIASGRVVLGNIGSPQRLEYTAIGEAVNLASRLCSKAEAGQIVVMEDVRNAVVDPRFQPAERIAVKGFALPVSVNRLSLTPAA